jgi:hypothetical protein
MEKRVPTPFLILEKLMPSTRYPRRSLGNGKYCYSGPECTKHPIEIKYEDAEQNVPSIKEFFATPEKIKTFSKQPLNSAVQSNLRWTGEKPEWWDKYKTDAEADGQLSITPELLDVIDSPMGKLAVIWQDEAQTNKERDLSLGSGFRCNVSYYKSFDTGKTVGYVKMTYMDEKSVERTFGNDEFTAYRWTSRYGGERYPFSDNYHNGDPTYGERNLTGEELLEKRRQVWLIAQKNMGEGITNAEGKYIPSYNLSEKNIPDDKTVAKDLKIFTKEINKAIKERKRYFETPYVDYSRVERPLSGQGYGAALYVYTAKKLAQQGKILRGSGIQSGSAQTLWENFTKHFPENITTVKLSDRGKRKTAPALDFRK